MLMTFKQVDRNACMGTFYITSCELFLHSIMCADSFKSYASADVKPTLHAVGFSRPYAGDAPNAGVGPVNSMLLTSLLMPLSGSNFGWYIVPFRGFI